MKIERMCVCAEFVDVVSDIKTPLAAKNEYYLSAKKSPLGAF